ncbi:hypothetical protein PgNI_10396 [Pyricularia grisea]|uniref:Uncharacterized protein n=1 Tax=Pyricularia grisea TaxID=148305 RepID=A0A6P8AX57_PYRGI|nr:hypothetical protein PgNI_10396 [Pyricularia grisea]TLD06907.1 hypothetical protein PgNI_10396 [Pyricularia grisea]
MEQSPMARHRPAVAGSTWSAGLLGLSTQRWASLIACAEPDDGMSLNKERADTRANLRSANTNRKRGMKNAGHPIVRMLVGQQALCPRRSFPRSPSSPRTPAAAGRGGPGIACRSAVPPCTGIAYSPTTSILVTETLSWDCDCMHCILSGGWASHCQTIEWSRVIEAGRRRHVVGTRGKEPLEMTAHRCIGQEAAAPGGTYGIHAGYLLETELQANLTTFIKEHFSNPYRNQRSKPASLVGTRNFTRKNRGKWGFYKGSHTCWCCYPSWAEPEPNYRTGKPSHRRPAALPKNFLTRPQVIDGLYLRLSGARTTVRLAETNGFHGLIVYSAPATKERLKWSSKLLGLNRRMPMTKLVIDGSTLFSLVPRLSHSPQKAPLNKRGSCGICVQSNKADRGRAPWNL